MVAPARLTRNMIVTMRDNGRERHVKTRMGVGRAWGVVDSVVATMILPLCGWWKRR